MVKAKGVPGSLSNPCQNNVQTPCGDSGSGNEQPCRIIPKRVCVTLTIDQYDNDFGCEDYNCSCEEKKQIATWDCDKEHYAGTIECGLVSFDYKLTFEFGDGDYCQMCLESECINVRFTDKICETAFGSCDEPIAEFDIDDISNCGDDNCTTAVLSVEKADDFCPPGTGGCLGCQNCGCICRCLSIGLISAECTDVNIVCWKDSAESWSTEFDCSTSPPACFGASSCVKDVGAIEATIILDEDYEGNCVLVLETNATIIGSEEQTPSCPSVGVIWDIEVEGSDGVCFTAKIKAACAICGEVSGAECLPCCPGEDVPCSLTAEITEATDDCDCFTGLTQGLLAVDAAGLTEPICDCGYDNELCGDAGSNACPLPDLPNNEVAVPNMTVDCAAPAGSNSCCEDMEMTMIADVNCTAKANANCSCEPLFLEYDINCDLSCNPQTGPDQIAKVEVTP